MSKTKCLKVRLTDGEHASLARRAVREGTTITNLVRVELGLNPGTVDSYANRVAARWASA